MHQYTTVLEYPCRMFYCTTVGHPLGKRPQTSGQSKYTDLGQSSSAIKNSVSNTTTSRVEEWVRGFSVMFQTNIYSE